MGRAAKVGDFYQTRLWIDYVFVAVLVATVVFTPLADKLSTDHRLGLFAGTVTLASLAMAAAIFARTMTYNSQSLVMRDARDRFDQLLHRSWSTIVRDLFVGALLGVSCFFVDAFSVHASVAIAIAAVLLTALRFSRAAFWMNFTQTADRISTRNRVIKQPSYT